MPSLPYSPPAYTPQNVLVGQAILMTSPLPSPGVGATLPSDSNLGVGAAWLSAGWTYNGATEAGVTLTFNPTTQAITIEEQPNPAGMEVSTSEIQITTNLSEETLNTINLTWGNGGTIATTAAGAGQPGKQVLTLSSNFQTLSAALIGQNEEGFARVFVIPEVFSAGQVQTAWRRAAQQRLYPLTLSAICALEDIYWVNLTAVATS